MFILKTKAHLSKDILLSLTPEGRIEFANQIGWKKFINCLAVKMQKEILVQ